MGLSQDVFSFINALPDAILIIDRISGKFVGANAAFFELAGFTNDVLLDTKILDLPFSAQKVKHELIRLFLNASRDKKCCGTYSFPHICGDDTVKNISASARKVAFEGEEYVFFDFRHVRPGKALKAAVCDADSWESYLALAYEPYMEFRPVAPIPPFDEQGNRMDFLHTLGESLRVKFSNGAADKFYQGGQGSLTGETFISFFNRANDAIRFLDMLYAVGQMKAETTVNTYNDFAVSVEMNCVVKFDDEGAIAVIYCAQRDLSGEAHYKTIIGGSKAEMDFMFSQPFIGFAYLLPPHPFERPQIDNLDINLDYMLNRITIVRANQTIIDIYDTEKSKFLMKPMRNLFYDAGVARQVLKELFVMRETSSAHRIACGDEGDSERVSIFRAKFDESDRLTGIIMVTSRHGYGYHARHISNDLPDHAVATE